MVDETRRSGGVAEHVLATMIDNGLPGSWLELPARTASSHSAMRFAGAFSEEAIENAAVKLLRG